MTEPTPFETQARRTIRDLRRNYKKTIKTVMSLKKKINKLELSISEKSSASTYANVKKLNSVIERLDMFVDSVILESSSAKSKYERLKHECAARGFEPVELKNLLTQYHENEQLAKDLLCYSLAHLKRTHHISPVNTHERRRH